MYLFKYNMFNFYKGLLKLDTDNVKAIADAIANEHCAYYAQKDPVWFSRFVNQTLFFYEDPGKMKNPITVLIANGYVHGIHPGTSRFLGSVLAGEKTIPSLIVSHIDPTTPDTLQKYFVDYQETDDYHFYTSAPCKNSFQPKTRDNVATYDDWIKEESIDDVAHRLIWSKVPNITWVDKHENVLFEKVTNEELEKNVVVIDNFHEFWQSLIKISTS